MNTYQLSLNLSVRATTENEAYQKAKAEAYHVLGQISENDLPHELPFELKDTDCIGSTPAANQLHDAVTELLLSLWDAEDDRHPESGLMYPTCAKVWVAVNEFRQGTGVNGGAVSPGILQEAREALEEEL